MASASPQPDLTGLGCIGSLACALCRTIKHEVAVLAGIWIDPRPGNASNATKGGQVRPTLAPLLEALAGLARLPRLDVLELVHRKDWLPEGGIPAQWVAPGAFPSLTK